MEGTLILSTTSALYEQIVCDAIPSINEQISASITRVPIITFKADQAFAFDTGATSSLSFTIVRTQHPDASIQRDLNEPDSRLWTNAKFERELTEYIDRWQAETDGCYLEFTPFVNGKNTNDQDTYAQVPIGEHVYLSSLSFRADHGKADTLYITLNADVGSMTAKTISITPQDAPAAKGYGEKVKEEEALITITSSDGKDHYVLYYGLQTEWNCVSNYSVKEGPESPFPKLSLKISKKNLSAVAPNLVEDIVPGKNRVFVHGIGAGEYIVTKTSTSGQYYKVEAYSVYEQYRAAPIGDDNNKGGFLFGANDNTTIFKTPMDIIFRILTDSNAYGNAGNRIFFALDDIIYCYRNDNNTWVNTGIFSKNTDAWYVLNVCALRLGCKIWFADNRAYIVDTSIPSSLVDNTNYVSHSSGFAFKDIPSLYVNMDLYAPENPTDDQIKFAQSVCDETVLGDEGSDVLKNYTVLTYYNSEVTAGPAVPSNLVTASRGKFGNRREVYTISEIKGDDAGAIAVLVNERYCDSEQSIGFKLAETHFEPNDQTRSGKYWQPYFPQLTRIGTIYDYSKDLMISNRSNFEYTADGSTGTHVLPNKLTLSTVEYFYPEGYAEYWFGIICPVDLTQNTSVINNIIQ